MASSAPKTDFASGDGFTNTQLNALEENVRVLQGGDAALPLSTDAAAPNALAKRDADGDIAFRDVAARDVAARDVAASGDITWPIDIEHDQGRSTTSASYIPVTRRIYIKRTCNIKAVFTVDVYNSATPARIYKNGEAVGIERTADGTYSEIFSAVPGDYFEVRAHAAGGPAAVTVSDFIISSGSTEFI